MKSFLKKPRSPIGIDIGRRRIKAAQFNRSATGWRLAAAASVRRGVSQPTIGPEEIRRLRAALAERGFKGNAIVLAVPAERLLSGIMELPPPDSGAPIDRLARSEMARLHKCDPQSLETCCWALPDPARAANTMFVMGVACTHADADRLLDVFEDESFDVERLDVQARALARSCRPLLDRVKGTAGIVDLGWTAARLILMYEGVVVYERKLPRSGVHGLIKALAAELERTEEQVERELHEKAFWSALSAGSGAGEADGDTAADRYLAGLVEEMRIPMSYLANQYPEAALERFLLVGGGATIPGLPDRLGAALACEVQAVLPSDLVICPESFDEQYGPALAAALGLSRPEEG